MAEKMKRMTFDQLKDKYLGEVGTPERDQFEFELKMDLLGEMVRTSRKERKLTQDQLGKLVGVQKSQISKLEGGAGNVTIATILKVFNALKANVKFRVELQNEDIELA